MIGYVSLTGRYFNLKYPLTEKIRDTRCKFDYKANPALEKIFVHGDNGEFNTEKATYWSFPYFLRGKPYKI